MINSDEAVLQVQPEQRPLEESGTIADDSSLIPRPIMGREMESLHTSLESLLPDTPQKIIQFLGSQPGEGVSTIVREYAWMATEKFDATVLIIDANPSEGGQKDFFRLESRNGWDEAVRELIPIDGAITRIGQSGLFVSSYSTRASGSLQMNNRAEIQNFFEKLRARFDIVLIDAPPATAQYNNSLTRCTDGVILVMEAEKTRWPVVESVKNRLINNGSNILGMVINKRRNFIPDFLYTRL